MSSNPNQGRLPVLVNLTSNERHELSGPSVTIGRAPDNTIIVGDDGYASGYHAKVYWAQGGWWIEDLHSSNGTTINEQIITAPYQLAPGNIIKIGRTKFRIE